MRPLFQFFLKLLIAVIASAALYYSLLIWIAPRHRTTHTAVILPPIEPKLQVLPRELKDIRPEILAASPRLLSSFLAKGFPEDVPAALSWAAAIQDITLRRNLLATFIRQGCAVQPQPTWAWVVSQPYLSDEILGMAVSAHALVDISKTLDFAQAARPAARSSQLMALSIRSLAASNPNAAAKALLALPPRPDSARLAAELCSAWIRLRREECMNFLCARQEPAFDRLLDLHLAGWLRENPHQALSWLFASPLPEDRIQQTGRRVLSASGLQALHKQFVTLADSLPPARRDQLLAWIVLAQSPAQARELCLRISEPMRPRVIEDYALHLAQNAPREALDFLSPAELADIERLDLILLAYARRSPPQAYAWIRSASVTSIIETKLFALELQYPAATEGTALSQTTIPREALLLPFTSSAFRPADILPPLLRLRPMFFAQAKAWHSTFARRLGLSLQQISAQWSEINFTQCLQAVSLCDNPAVKDALLLGMLNSGDVGSRPDYLRLPSLYTDPATKADYICRTAMACRFAYPSESLALLRNGGINSAPVLAAILHDYACSNPEDAFAELALLSAEPGYDSIAYAYAYALARHHIRRLEPFLLSLRPSSRRKVLALLLPSLAQTAPELLPALQEFIGSLPPAERPLTDPLSINPAN